MRIWTAPVEVEDRTSFEQDRHHTAYDPEYAQHVWRILLQTTRVLMYFCSRVIEGEPGALLLESSAANLVALA